ncbi:hypothetical protein KRX53_03250 [Dermabacteraceae bacterium TAE3-ERU5]|nr:hypothetical protein [Dermabacteraceae bacterium TAE3-ERU5]
MPDLIDLDEQALYRENPEVLTTLLKDRSAGRNILWATDDYSELGAGFTREDPITPEKITGRFCGVIRPRSQKSRATQARRVKDQAEVFTPSWVCNAQNNLIDEAWFNHPGVFNTVDDQKWVVNTEPIIFPKDDPARSWQAYVTEPRLEITCGEAPYLVSRYDTVTGHPIDVTERIGILDRKLRVVSENCDSAEMWLRWAELALKASYGFEYQGDNLLLARENILLTYLDYRENSIVCSPSTTGELARIAEIISWNLWQMDGLTQHTPSIHEPETEGLFSLTPAQTSPHPCQIMDWEQGKPILFSSLLTA